MVARYIPKPEEIPSGICECGCGKQTALTKYTWRKKRHFRGYPAPYLRGHTPGRFKSGPDSHKWKGGRTTNKGYVYIYRPGHPAANRDGYVFEHRLVMEAVLGRFLEPHEHVHHRNGDRADNRPENLEVLTNSEHKQLHGVPELERYHTAHPDARRITGRKGAEKRWGRGR